MPGPLQSVFFPFHSAADCFLPASNPFLTFVIGNFRGEGPVDCPVFLNIIHILPVANSKACQICCTHGGSLYALGAQHRCIADIRLSLNEIIIGGSSAVYLQCAERNAGVCLHGTQNVICLIGHGIQRGPDDVIFIDTPGKTDNSTSGISIPVGSTQTRECGHDVASTGVIGKQLPIDRICSGIDTMVPALDGSPESGHNAALAIMTTDTHEKEIAVEFELDGKIVTIGGMCKGSGMIHPNMCTMLSFVTTDVAISKELLQEALSADVQDTYNMISVDGDTSTNDTCLLLANGMAGNKLITEKNADYEAFVKALNFVNEYLAKQMAGDGEGATALFEVKIVGAETKEQAKVLSKSVITSSLTKAAIYGHDANWGRILCAMGYSGANFDPEKVDLFFESAAGKLQIIENGVAVDYSEEEASKILSEPHVTAIADIKMGDATATAWGCDLTYDYVKINADYRS